MTQLENARNQIVDEFSTVLNEAEDLLKKAGQETGDKARDFRALAEKKLLTAKLRIQQLEGQAVDQAKAAVRYTDDYVHDHPWASVGRRGGNRLRLRRAADPSLTSRRPASHSCRCPKLRPRGRACGPRSRGWRGPWWECCRRARSSRASSSPRNASA